MMSIIRRIVITLYKKLGCEFMNQPIAIPESSVVECIISTPEFKHGKVHKMCKQSGKFYKDTNIFFPYNNFRGYKIVFGSYENFKRYVVKVIC